MTNKKIKIIGAGNIDIEGWKKIGKSFLVTLGGAAIGFGLDFIGMIDYGSYETIAITLLPFISNAVRKWLGKYESLVK